MSIALYRKYRPTKFGEVTNQNHVKVTLQNELESGKLAHAYLFCGPRGTGKTTLARLLSKASNCLDLQEGGEPCNSCASCTDIIEGKAMDIIEIDAASHTGVDNVRENIINNSRFTPTKLRYKVFIIDEVHMLSNQAFNALLKTLEEPPKHVIFILATTEIQKVPLTIISRCQRFDFRKIIVPELVKRLHWIVGQEGVKVDNKILEVVAKNAGGCVRDAESLLEQVLSLGGDSINYDQAQLILPRTNSESYYELVGFLLKKDTKSAIELINVLVEEGIDLQHYFNSFIDFVRRCMIYRITGNAEELVQEMDEKLVEKVIDLIKQIEVNKLLYIIDVFLKSKDLFKQSYILQLPFEVAIIEITHGIYTNNVKVFTPESSSVAPVVATDIQDTTDITEVNTEEMKEEATDLQDITDTTEVISENNEEKMEEVKSEVEEVKDEEIVEEVNEVVQAQPREIVTNGNGISLTFNQVVSRWPAIIAAITKRNYTLGLSLAVAKPIKLDGDVMHIGFMFDLQKSRVDTPDNIIDINAVFQTEFGTTLKVELVVDSNLKLNDLTRGSGDGEVIIEQDAVVDPVDQAINAFGGSVVDKI